MIGLPLIRYPLMQNIAYRSTQVSILCLNFNKTNARVNCIRWIWRAHFGDIHFSEQNSAPPITAPIQIGAIKYSAYTFRRPSFQRTQLAAFKHSAYWNQLTIYSWKNWKELLKKWLFMEPSSQSMSCVKQTWGRHWDMVTPWLRRLLSTGGSWVRLPL